MPAQLLSAVNKNNRGLIKLRDHKTSFKTLELIKGKNDKKHFAASPHKSRRFLTPSRIVNQVPQGTDDCPPGQWLRFARRKTSGGHLLL